MQPLSVSIIIPTYNRIEILEICLNKLGNQTVPLSNMEMIIVDDGSTDKTKITIAKIQNTLPINYIYQDNLGPAAARNKGILAAKNDIVLLLGDDIYSDIRLVEQHLEWHKQFPNLEDAVLGLIEWDPSLTITHLMDYVNRGPQFAFQRIKDIHNAGFAYFYSSNISLKKSFLLDNGLFDEDFKKAACEDTELGYRLKQKGLKIHFCKEAIGYHSHPLTYEDYKNRAILVGRETILLQRKHPGVFERKNRIVLRILTKLFLPLLETIAKKSSHSNGIMDLIYRVLFLHYFHQGLKTTAVQ
jgi:glycosyltransferase involved in cell wall biosynthesis